MSLSKSSNGPQVSRRRALLIVNPGARRGSETRGTVVRLLERLGVTCDAFVTKEAGHATALAREHAAQYDVVFTLGGDGTAMEVITALADRGPPVAILPGGTGNILVRALGIPLRLSRAVPALLGGTEARIDLGQMADGRHFAIGLGVGLDEAMIAGASPLMKKRVGLLAYVWSATRATFRLQHFKVRLTVDGKVYEREASFVLIANLGAIPVFGGLIRWGDGILHDDGVLHACVYSPKNFAAALRLFARVIAGSAQADPAAFYVSGREFRLETDPPRRAQADGELLDVTPIEITVRPLAARLLIPTR